MNIFTQTARNIQAAWHECRAQQALAWDMYDLAGRHARALYALEPEQPHATFLLAQVLIQAGRHGEALRHLERAAQDWPDDAPTFYAIAVCHDYLDEPDAAIQAYRRTLELSPHWIITLKHIGRCCYRLDDVRGAEQALTRYCAQRPEDKEAHDLLGYVSYRQGHLRLAYGHYVQAHSLDPRDPQMERNARLLYHRSATS